MEHDHTPPDDQHQQPADASGPASDAQPHHCDEHARFLRHRNVRQLGEQMALPEDLLEHGCEQFLTSSRSRREMLGLGAGALVTLGLATSLGPARLLEEAAAAESGQRVLVCIYLQGGNDGLNTLVPTSGAERSRYDQIRPHVNIPASQLLPVTGRSDLGWHPSAAGLKALHDAGKLSAITGVDYPNPNFSHFESEHFWRTGTLSARTTTGWLGRYLDRVGGRKNPLQGLAMGWGGDGVLHGRRAPVASVASLDGLEMWTPGVWNSRRLEKWWNRAKVKPRSRAYRAARDTISQTITVNRRLRPVADRSDGGQPSPAYPDGELATQLRLAGRLLAAGLGTRVITLTDDADYDTHDDQLEPHARNLERLGSTLQAWQADLERRGLADRVMTMVWSEFGRRAHDNESGGTDHGAGGLVFTVGTGASGTIESPGWDLSRLDDGNLRVARDFRDVYAAMLEQHLRFEARDVLTGYRGTPPRLVA